MCNETLNVFLNVYNRYAWSKIFVNSKTAGVHFIEWSRRKKNQLISLVSVPHQEISYVKVYNSLQTTTCVEYASLPASCHLFFLHWFLLVIFSLLSLSVDGLHVFGFSLITIFFVRFVFVIPRVHFFRSETSLFA